MPTQFPHPHAGEGAPVPAERLGPTAPEAPEVRPPSLPAPRYREGGELDDLGSVSPEEAENSAGSID